MNGTENVVDGMAVKLEYLSKANVSLRTELHRLKDELTGWRYIVPLHIALQVADYNRDRRYGDIPPAQNITNPVQFCAEPISQEAKMCKCNEIDGPISFSKPRGPAFPGPGMHLPRLETQARIENNFKYHAPKPGQQEKYEAIRETAKILAYMIEDVCPASREASLAMTNLEQSVMWANASIARNE